MYLKKQFHLSLNIINNIKRNFINIKEKFSVKSSELYVNNTKYIYQSKDGVVRDATD